MAELQNRTFIDMIRSMMSTRPLPEYFLGEGLKQLFSFNRVPSKSVPKTLLNYKLVSNRVLKHS